MLNIPEEIKNLFRKTSKKKEVIIHFPNGEHEDITNKNLISESFSFTESICSKDNLQFGLCEESMVEFDCFDIGNIENCEIDVKMQISATSEKWNMASGTYKSAIVDSTEYKVLDYVIKDKITTEKRIGISFDYEVVDANNDYVDKSQRLHIRIGASSSVVTTLSKKGRLRHVYATLVEYPENSKISMYIDLPEYPVVVSNVAVNYGESGTDYPKWNISETDGIVPIGKFYVDSCKRQSDLRKRKVVAYTKSVINQKEIPELEKIKQGTFSINNTDYEVDLSKFVYSSIPGIDSSDLTVTAIHTDPLQINESYYTDLGTGREAKVTCYSRTIFFDFKNDVPNYSPYPTPQNMREFNALYRCNIEKMENSNSYSGLEQTKERINQLLSTGYFSYDNGQGFTNAEADDVKRFLDCYCEIRLLKRYTDYNVFFEKYATLENGQLIYPFINGFGDGCEVAMFAVWLPRQIVLQWTDTNQTEYLYLYDASLERLSTDHLPSMELSFPRKKRAEYSFYDVDNSKIQATNIISSFCEINALFGRNRRDGKYDFIHISNSYGIYPSETLYPSEDLYPLDATGGIVSTYDYKSLWYEEYEVKEFGKVVVNYLNEEGNNAVFQYVFDESKPNVYTFSDNYIFKNFKTNEDFIKTLIETYFIPNIQNIRYVPFEISMIGLPYVEAGDAFNVLTRNDGFETFVFQRYLSGIHNLTDEIESRGLEVNPDTSIENATIN